MKKIILLLLINLTFSIAYSNELEKCEWKNVSGKPCLTIFSPPNTSKITELSVGKTVITKKQMNESGYKDVRSVLEQVAGLDVYSDGPRGQKTSIFMRGTNSNHTLVLLNGIPINDQSSPKAMFDFGRFINSGRILAPMKASKGLFYRWNFTSSKSSKTMKINWVL